jgi:hypothetical protein
MGTWGFGNFDSDAACDLRDEEVRRLRADFETLLQSGECRVEDLDIMMAALAMYMVLLRHCGGEPVPDERTVIAWRDGFLRVLEEGADDLDPTGTFKGPRREVIEGTFTQLLALVRERGGP